MHFHAMGYNCSLELGFIIFITLYKVDGLVAKEM
jgi:hypothetical protein